MILSKSDYLLFLKHPAWLWLKKHDKSKLTPVSENLQAVFDAGNDFETYAEQLFPGGVRIGFDGYDEYLTQPARTKKAIDDGATVLFQGRFEHEHITCICDVVVITGEHMVDLYEIKSSTEAKLIHEHDLAFQMVVLESCGYTVGSIKVLCVNSEFVRFGDIDPKQLVLTQDITNAVLEKREDTKKHIQKAFRTVESTTLPDISPSKCGFGSLKEWLEIYRTLTHVPLGSIYDLCRLNTELISDLESRSIKYISDIPDDIALKSQQALQVRVSKENRVIINIDEIRNFLSRLVFPLYFLDYETLSSTVPFFDGTKPYQQVPFQYSLHIVESPTAELTHVGYLHTERSNPVQSLTKSLQSSIGITGTVLVWFEGFEKSRNTEMGELIPEFKEFYEHLNGRVIDLMTPFSNGWYAHKEFLGSSSIKKVLPVIVPELSYSELDVHEGATAQRLWMETVLDGEHLGEKEKILKDLDVYCTLDTMAMVKIYEKLSEIITSI